MVGCDVIGNTEFDLIFVDLHNDDYHISCKSPCIDVADNALVLEAPPAQLDHMGRMNVARATRSSSACSVSKRIRLMSSSTLQSRYPQLQITGTCAPEYGFENDPAQIDRIGDMLVAAASDIIYVALGSPKQERLIRQLRGRLPAAWWIGVGISFSFVAGHVKRAPRWMQRYDLEWMHRLGQEPRRLARRYLVQGLPFGARVLVSSMVKGWRVAEAQTKPATSASADRAALRRVRPPARMAQSGSSRSLGRQRSKQPSGDRPANRPTR